MIASDAANFFRVARTARAKPVWRNMISAITQKQTSKVIDATNDEGAFWKPPENSGGYRMPGFQEKKLIRKGVTTVGESNEAADNPDAQAGGSVSIFKDVKKFGAKEVLTTWAESVEQGAKLKEGERCWSW